jgi:uncharacterized protein YfaS (alpha-2-macroglobulin family)
MARSEYEFEREMSRTEYDSVELYNYLDVKPATQFSISTTPGGFFLVGDFKPRTSYTVHLKKGLRAKDGTVLSETTSKTVETGNFPAGFKFKTNARYLPESLQGSLSWESVNLKKVKFTVRQVYPQNIHQWLTSSESTSPWTSDETKTKIETIKGKLNQTTKGSFSLSDLNVVGQGIFEVQAYVEEGLDTPKNANIGSTPPPPDEGDGGEYVDGTMVTQESSPARQGQFLAKSTLVVTNLSLVTKQSAKDEISVWVLNTKDLSPIGEANVDLLSQANRKISSCKSQGGTGFCQIKWKESPKNTPYAVVVRSGKDSTFLRLSDLVLSNDPFHAGNRNFNSSAGTMEAYLFAERDLYRPGETVNLAAMVRNKDIETVENLPLRWVITSPRGKVVRETITETSALGMTYLSYSTSAASDTGKYTVTVASGDRVLHDMSFLVEEFVPERIGVKMKPTQEFVVNPKSVLFDIQANYLFGPPVAQGRFTTSCWMKPAFTTIPKNPDYATGIYGKESKNPINLQANEGTLNPTGGGQSNCDMGTLGTNKLPETYELKSKVEVSEAGSARVSTKSAFAYVGATDGLIGIKLKNKQDHTIFFEGKLFNYKGDQLKRPMKIQIKLFRRTEQWYYAYDRGEYDGDSWKVEELISPAGVEKTIDSTDGSFSESLRVTQDWGDWIVRAVDTKTGYTADLNAGSLGWWYDDSAVAASGSRAPQPEQLKVEVSATELSPGDDLKAMVTAPFSGRILFTLETDRVIETKWIDIDKPGPVTANFKVPNVIPNVYVSALLLKRPYEKNSNRWIPARAWGAKSVNVISSTHRLNVKLVHPELSESRKTVAISIENAQNTPAEYVLAAVDEGILQMTNFTSPDPVRRFFEPRRMGVNSAETLGWTVAYSGNGKTPGGDESGGAKNKTMPVTLVAYWFPKILSDANGKANVSITLPSFQGKLRLMVVASSKSRIGSSFSEMTVRDPLVLQSTLPRFLTQGDKFSFPATITNLSGQPQTVKVQVSTDSNVTVAKREQSFTLTNEQQKTSLFEAEVKGVINTAVFNIKAQSENGKLMSEEKFELPLKPAGVEQMVRLALPADKESNLGQWLPGNWRSDYLRLEATVSNLPYLDQLGHLTSLIHYPYGCIEQTTSSTMPLLSMGALLPWITTKNDKHYSNLNDMVYRGITRILSMQTVSGGFAYWPGDTNPNPWGTAYATYMLLEAKKLGFEVSTTALDSALTYLLNFVRESPYGFARARYNEGAIPLALFVLAKAGKAVTPELRTAAKNGKADLPIKNGSYVGDGMIAENMFLMTATAKLLGDKDTLSILGNENLFSASFSGERDYAYTYWSPLRSDGMRLAILQDLLPDHPANGILATRVAAELSKQNYYYSTQDIAWAMIGLSKRLQNAKKVDPKTLAKTQLVWNGKKITKSIEMMGYPGFSFVGPMNGGSKINLIDAPKGAGLYLYVKATGYTKTPPVSNNKTLEISRSFYQKNGTAITPSTIKRGDTFVVALTIRNNSHTKLSNLAIVDRLPAGFEIENPRIKENEELSWLKDVFTPEYQDLRDDRIQVFGTLTSRQTAVIYYSVRAVTKGSYVAPASFIEAMYEPSMFDYDQDLQIQILD